MIRRGEATLHLWEASDEGWLLHQVSHEGVSGTDYGTREFATVDDDGNLISFFRWVE